MSAVRPGLRVLALALLAGALGTQESGAQDAQRPAAPSAEAAPTPAPGPIPAADVPAAAERTRAELRRFDAVLEPRAGVAAVASALDARTEEIRRMRSSLDRLDRERLSARYLHDLRLGWRDLSADLRRWRTRLDERWKAVQEVRDALQHERERWEATRRRASEAGFPEELIQSIDGILGELGKSLARVRQRSDDLARVIDRLSQEGSATDAALTRLAELSSALRSGLLERDDVPVWRLGERARTAGLGEEARSARRYWLTRLKAWGADRPGALLLLAALLVAFIAGTLALRRRSEGWLPDDPSRAAARDVVSRPWSAGLAFALAVFAFAVGEVPSPVTDVIGLLAAVPVIRLGIPLVAPALRPAVVGIVASSVFARAWALSPDGSLLRRLLLLGGAAAALIGARLVLRRWRREDRGAWGRAVSLGLGLASVLLAVSVVSNLLGWVNLAHHLGDATIQSAFAAVAWLVVVRATRALLPLLRGAPARRLPILERQGARLEWLAGSAVALAALGLWAWTALARFDVATALADAVTGALGASLRVGGLEISAGAILASVAILVLTVPFSRGLRLALEEELVPRLQLPAGADNSVLTLVNYTVIGVGLLLAAGAAGLSSTQLAVAFGALGVGIGFGLQNVVNNFVSGLILIFERPIKVGDRVETAAHLGMVTRIGIRSSTVRTFDGAEVVVPNGDLISKEVINWTLSDQTRRVDMRVGVAYGSDPHRVIEVLGRVATSNERVLGEPAPAVLMAGFGDSSLDFRVLAWVKVEDFLEVSSRLHLDVHEALKREGIEIPFPQRDLHLRSVAGSAAAGLRGGGPEESP